MIGQNPLNKLHFIIKEITNIYDIIFHQFMDLTF